MKCSLGISNFLEEMSSLSHSVDFLYFFAFVTWEGFLISPCYSLGLYIQMDLAFLFSFFLFLLLSLFFISQLFVSPHQTTILPFCISSSLNKSCSPSDRVEAPLLGPALDIKPLISFFFFLTDSEVVYSFVLNLGKQKPCRPLLMQPNTGHSIILIHTMMCHFTENKIKRKKNHILP